MDPVFNIGDKVKIKKTEEAIRINKGYGFDLDKVYTITQVEPSFPDSYRYYINTNPAVNLPADWLSQEV